MAAYLESGERSTHVYKAENGRNRVDPKVLSQFVQLAFNTAVAAMGLYLSVRFVQLVNMDVQRKMKEKSLAMIKLSVDCRQQYTINRCHPDHRAPALEAKCSEWFHCMNNEVTGKDIQQSATMWAETLAEIINAFLKPISVRSLLFILITTCGIIIVTNMAFYNYRVQYYGIAQDPDKSS